MCTQACCRASDDLMRACNELEDAGGGGVQGSVVYLPGRTGERRCSDPDSKRALAEHTPEAFLLKTVFSVHLKCLVKKTGHNLFSRAFRTIY
jgi:hypothetical protein